MKIDSGSTMQGVRERLGVGDNEKLRESEKRRRYLEKFTRIITPERPNLRMIEDLPTAACDQEGDQPTIHMTTREFEQPITDFPDKVFDLIMQEALTVHEIGHVLYTNHESFKSYLGKVDVERKSMFKNIWNVLEDGAIEKQLRHRFRVSDELEVLNRNLMEKDPPGHMVDDDTIRYSFFQAVRMALIDMALWDTGQFQKVMDEDNDECTLASEEDRELLEDFLPEMRAVSKDVLSQPNSEKRNERIYAFWEKLAEKLDEADVSGQNESSLENLIGSDGSVGDNSNGGEDDQEQNVDNAPFEGKPDDTENNIGDDSVEASELGRGDVQQEVEIQVEVASGGQPSPKDIDSDMESASGGQDGEDEDEYSDPREEESALDGNNGRSEQELVDQFRDELAQEAAELDGGEALMNEAEEFLEIIQDGAGDEYRGFTMELPEDPASDFARSRWNEAEKIAKRLERDFQNRLLRERRTKVKRGKRRGSFDRNRMIHAARGSTRVFKKEEEGDEKDYSCIIVLDRSGSMHRDGIREAESAVASLSASLEGVGVDTSVIDLYESESRLVKPFGQDAFDVKEHLVNGSAGGGTPLTEVLHLARERVTDHDNPFMIVITDGQPGNERTYRDELSKCHFPVLGVYLSSSRHESDEKYFHRQVYVENGDEIRTKLHNLANEVMF